VTYIPTTVKRVRHISNGFSLERRNYYDPDFTAGTPFHSGAIIFEADSGIRIDHLSVIADIALGPERAPIDRPNGRDAQPHQEAQPQPHLHLDFSVYYAASSGFVG
jgi:hypothetical protein